MPKIKITRKVIKNTILRKSGFDYAPLRGKGSHLAFTKTEKGRMNPIMGKLFFGLYKAGSR